MRKTLKDYLLKGGVEGKLFKNPVVNTQYRVMDIERNPLNREMHMTVQQWPISDKNLSARTRTPWYSTFNLDDHLTDKYIREL